MIAFDKRANEVIHYHLSDLASRDRKITHQNFMLKKSSSILRRAYESVVFARKLVSFVSIFEHMQVSLAIVFRYCIVHRLKLLLNPMQFHRVLIASKQP